MLNEHRAVVAGEVATLEISLAGAPRKPAQMRKLLAQPPVVALAAPMIWRPG